MDIATFGLEEEAQVTLKFKINRDVLITLVEKTAVVVPLKEAIPVLANFKIQASSQALRIITTNLEISMVCATKDVAIEQAGEAFFPVRRFLEIVKLCPKGATVTITVTSQVAIISAITVVWTLNLHSGIGYPSLPEVTELQMQAVSREALSSALRTTKYAASSNPSKPSLMMIQCNGECVLSCDGVRYHQSAFPLPLSISIPLDAVDDILALLDRTSSDEVLLGEATNHIVLQAGSDVLVINKLIAEFPDVSTLIGPAQRHKESFIVEREALITAIKQCKLAADVESPAMSFEIVKEELKLRTNDRFGNKAYAALDIERPASAMIMGVGAKLILTLHYRMMLEALTACKGKLVSVYFGHGAKNQKLPVLIRDEETGSFAVLSQLIS